MGRTGDRLGNTRDKLVVLSVEPRQETRGARLSPLTLTASAWELGSAAASVLRAAWQ